jgi:hypothetical protein
MPAIIAARPEPRCMYYYKARPGQEFFLDEFLTPVAKEVKRITDTVKGETLAEVGAKMFEPVKEINYVTDQEGKGVPEYFKYPVETLKDGTGDCEDQAYLLASLLTGTGVQNVTVMFGTVEVEGKSFGHAWVEAEGKFIESTYPEYKPLDQRPDFYHPEIAVSWGYSYPMGAPLGWQVALEIAAGPFGQEVTRVLPQPSPEDLEKLHKKLAETEKAGAAKPAITVWTIPGKGGQ